jgi:hypothetical protein
VNDGEGSALAVRQVLAHMAPLQRRELDPVASVHGESFGRVPPIERFKPSDVLPGDPRMVIDVPMLEAGERGLPAGEPDAAGREAGR